ncbi:hypothetical protein FIBSPDRAFT_1019854 [Athelia psychrophila]|uniref:Uncharacterized protein n=1 Tax=Athelia psychrophila TaxID=1759441 RepID=A0A166K636_9AGAM|nr:hypothetical protein FIBSPDRAFT_1019854 [Fibularhizoctonia sp. CBS 109695]
MCAAIYTADLAILVISNTIEGIRVQYARRDASATISNRTRRRAVALAFQQKRRACKGVSSPGIPLFGRRWEQPGPPAVSSSFGGLMEGPIHLSPGSARRDGDATIVRHVPRQSIGQSNDNWNEGGGQTELGEVIIFPDAVFADPNWTCLPDRRHILGHVAATSTIRDLDATTCFWRDITKGPWPVISQDQGHKLSRRRTSTETLVLNGGNTHRDITFQLSFWNCRSSWDDLVYRPVLL